LFTCWSCIPVRIGSMAATVGRNPAARQQQVHPAQRKRPEGGSHGQARARMAGGCAGADADRSAVPDVNDATPANRNRLMNPE
jgi:hypothetical protein